MIPLPNEPTAERSRRSRFANMPAIGTEAELARAGARMFRVVSTIDRLRRDGSLSARQADAGDRLRDDYEVGVGGARDGSGGHSGAAVGFYYAERRLDCLRSYISAVRALGPRLAGMVVPICIGWAAGGDITIAELARLRGINRQECAGMVKLALDALADHYGFA